VHRMILAVSHVDVLRVLLVNGAKFKMDVLVNHARTEVLASVLMMAHTHVSVVPALKDQTVNRVRQKMSLTTQRSTLTIVVDICGVKNPCICGTCQSDPYDPQGFRCFCPPGYSGSRCEKSELRTCELNSTCPILFFLTSSKYSTVWTAEKNASMVDSVFSVRLVITSVRVLIHTADFAVNHIDHRAMVCSYDKIDRFRER
jgi:hypothetical protein